MIECPICNAPATVRQFAYEDYETGYRDSGVTLICTGECGVLTEPEVMQILDEVQTNGRA